MGEIATWSAVKTKVGLGKTGNDCPTKAELLALSPTGTGENYVGLELSNASSYGNNECVQLADIHKVTYKYTLTAENYTLTFSASGGGANTSINITSTRQKYVDGIATGDPTFIGLPDPTVPSWITFSDDIYRRYRAAENLDLSPRTGTAIYTQNESGKTLSINLVQAAATQSWDYTFSVSPTSMSFAASGETKTFSVSSSKQEYRNGHTYGSAVAVLYSRTNSGSISGEGTSVTMGNNTSTSSRSGTVRLVQSETNKSLTISCSQAAGYKTYSEITITKDPTCNDIPASGGSIGSFATQPEYSQTWGWNGSTTGGGTITSGASITYGNLISAPSLGTTEKERTLIGTLDSYIRLNGKDISVSAYVYQQANRVMAIEDIGEGLTVNPGVISSIPSSGGSYTVDIGFSVNKKNIYTSGEYIISIERESIPNSSNFSYTIDIASFNWISVSKIVSGESISGVRVSVKPNPSYYSRNGYFLVRYPYNGKDFEEMISLQQEGQDRN